jgi:hypothetical protein
MLRNSLIILKCLCKIGWTEIVKEVTMAVTSYVQGLKMMFVFTSMRTKLAVSMKPSPINAQPFRGGMKTWPQIELGTKPFNSARVYVSLAQRWFNFQ